MSLSETTIFMMVQGNPKIILKQRSTYQLVFIQCHFPLKNFSPLFHIYFRVPLFQPFFCSCAVNVLDKKCSINLTVSMIIFKICSKYHVSKGYFSLKVMGDSFIIHKGKSGHYKTFDGRPRGFLFCNVDKNLL